MRHPRQVFGSASCGHYGLLDVFCVGLNPVVRRLGAFGPLEWGGLGSTCFMDDAASDVWCQNYRLRVIGVHELLCRVGKTGRGEVSLILLCKNELFCNLPATTRNRIWIKPINSDFASIGRTGP